MVVAQARAQGMRRWTSSARSLRRAVALELAHDLAGRTAHALIKRPLIKRAEGLGGELGAILRASEGAMHLRRALPELAGALAVDGADDIGRGGFIEIATGLQHPI